MLELVRLIQFRDRDRVCCYDVSVSQCHALKVVVDAASLTVNELAARLYLDKSTASRIAQSLVEKGYLERRSHHDDARRVELVPTSAGAALCATIDVEETREYAALLEDFGPGTRAELVRLMRALGRCFRQGVDVSGGSCCVVR
ncbi:MAG TPA: MarR family transcriptional regulator [Longimicrobiales bacterium]|nr:MarR family transcriptional regulator [Longimicrobiales bacterium]